MICRVIVATLLVPGMKILSALIVSATLVLGLGAAAHAAELAGGPLIPPADGSIACQIVNLSSKDIGMTVRIFTSTGVLLQIGVDPTLSPGEVILQLNATDTARYCTFSGSFNKNAVRATVSVRDASALTTAAVEAR